MNVRNIERYDFYLNPEGLYTVKTTLGKEVELKLEIGKMKECKHSVLYAADLGEVFKKIEERRKEDLALIDKGGKEVIRMGKRERLLNLIKEMRTNTYLAGVTPYENEKFEKTYKELYDLIDTYGIFGRSHSVDEYHGD